MPFYDVINLYYNIYGNFYGVPEVQNGLPSGLLPVTGKTVHTNVTFKRFPFTAISYVLVCYKVYQCFKYIR
jgi:hypothetical protein